MNYEKILKGIVQIINTAENSDIGFANICDYIGENCSELKENENEDEKIIKWIIDDIRYNMNNELLNNSEYKKEAEKAITWLEKQGQVKEYTFKSIPRLLEMIEQSDRAMAYCQKLIDTLINEGYAVDAKIVCECLKKMCGEKVALATMDDQKINKLDDERIRKELISFVRNDGWKFTKLTKEEKESWVAWLEKRFCDSIELKFNVGDWIIFNENHDSVFQVEKIQGLQYYLRHYMGGSMSVHIDNQLIRPWTIEDAKPGDVLVASDGSLFIFAKVKDNSVYHHFVLLKDGIKKISDGRHAWETASSCHPATKEQRDILMKAITDAGYEWDAEKKELRKMEQVSAWSEEDETVLNNLIYALANDRIGNDRDEYISWLKSIKQRMEE